MAEKDREEGVVDNEKALKGEEKIDSARSWSRDYLESGRTRRSVSACISIFLLLIGAVALTLWLVYRPSNPQFTVVGATIYELNMSSLPPLLSITMQFKIITRNPNTRVSIYYDRLGASVWYRNQQITSHVLLPPLFHERRSTVVMSPVVGTDGAVPLSLEVANGLAMDQAIGVLQLRLVLVGRRRWKAGPIKTAPHTAYVKCDMLLAVKTAFLGQLPLLSYSPCQLHI